MPSEHETPQPKPKSKPKSKPKAKAKPKPKAKASLPALLLDLRTDPTLSFRVDAVGEAMAWRPRLVVTQLVPKADGSDEKEEKVVCQLDLDRFDTLAIELFDCHILGNTRVSGSGWLARTKEARKALGFTNPTADIKHPQAARIMQIAAAGQARREWLDRFDACAKKVAPETLYGVGYADLSGAATKSAEELAEHNRVRPLAALQSAVRKMEVLHRIAEDNRVQEERSALREREGR